MEPFHSFFEAFPHTKHILLSMCHEESGRRVVALYPCGMEYVEWLMISQKLHQYAKDTCQYRNFVNYSPSSMMVGINRFYDQLKNQGFRKEYGSKLTMSSPELIHHWWFLTSASVAQLEAVKKLGMEELILESLYRQGVITGMAQKKKGPSVVEHRWASIFPDVFALVPVLQTLKIPFKQAKEMLRPAQLSPSGEAENFDFS